MAAIAYALATLKAKFETDREEGATAVEYGLLVALIAAVIVVAVGLLGGYINTAFEAINTQLAP